MECIYRIAALWCYPMDLNTGSLAGPYLHSGKLHDMNPQIQWAALPTGALRIGDLGYYNLKRFKDMDSEGVYWLSRVKSNCVVYYHDKRCDLPGLLMKCCKDRMDIQVLLGADERVPCRLLAVRVDAVSSYQKPRTVAHRKSLAYSM